MIPRRAATGHVVSDTVWSRAPEPGTDPGWVGDQNRANTDAIRRRADELGQRHPDKRDWFDDYVRRQEEESARLESGCVCALLLLAPTTRVTMTVPESH